MTRDTEAIEAAVKAYRRAKKTADERYETLVQLIMEADASGAKQADIVRATGYTRDNIRQMLRRRRAQQAQSAAAESAGEQLEP